MLLFWCVSLYKIHEQKKTRGYIGTATFHIYMGCMLIAQDKKGFRSESVGSSKL